MNRVAGRRRGVIQLEDPIDDGWSGIIVAKVTPDVSQVTRIRDLRIECENGFPFYIQASYKGVIRHCSTLACRLLAPTVYAKRRSRHCRYGVVVARAQGIRDSKLKPDRWAR